MLSQQEISDRFEIQDLLYRYAELIDGKRFDELRDVFHEDAHIDYSAFGGSVGDREETIAFLKKAMPLFPNTQHLNANLQITVEGDSGRGRVMCLNPQEMTLPDGSTQEIPASAGDVLFTPAGPHLPKNIADEAWELVLVELK